MSEIWSLSAICRCCHVDGNFKSLNSHYTFQESIEVYSEMIQDTLGIDIKLAPFDASYSICDDCIQHLRDATRFKKQVLECEIKFQEYCKNELATLTDVKEEITAPYQIEIKVEKEDNTITNRAEHLVEVKIEGHSISCDDDEHQPMDDDDDIDDPVEDSSSVPCDKGNFNKATVKLNTLAKKNDGSIKELIEISRDITCAICKGTYKDKIEFRKHLMEHQKPYKCPRCIIEYKNYYYFETHTLNCGLIQTKTLNIDFQNVTMYKCDMCKKEYIHKSSLKKHIIWHNGTNKKFVCPTCGRAFNDSTNLKSHRMTVHDKIKPYKCTRCPNAYAANKNLKIHYRKHTSERPCNVSSDSFLSSSDSNVQEKKDILPPHDPISKYICKTCDTPFEHKGIYLSHLKTHVNLKHLKCSICDKDFSSKYSLGRHILAHSGVKSHRCGICNQEFTQKAQLIRHEKRFHDPSGVVLEKVECKICGKNVTNIETHLKIHNNRSFACEFCDKTYPERNALTRHTKERHSGGKPFPCTLCDKKYIKKQRFRDHMMRVHNTPLVLKDVQSPLISK